jgi:hypothetical protein
MQIGLRTDSPDTYKRLTRAVLFYMYWNCDIGEVGDVETD